MIDTLEGDGPDSDIPHAPGPVTYTIKVLSAGPEGSHRPLRTVLFRRSAAGESIEINAETDTPNLLAELPRLLEAALSLQRARRSSAHLADESRLVRWLTEGERPGRRGVLRLVGMAYRAGVTDAPATAARAGAPRRARGWGALRPRRRRGR